MVPTLVCALLILLASLVGGRALMALLGGTRPSWLAGAVGFAALVVVAPLAVRLPGRALTAGVVIALALAASAVIVARASPGSGRGDARGSRAGDGERAPERAPHLAALAVVVITLAAASLPFLFNERVGVLGEGIYTNDHAAQLYWADWLQNGFGPQPNAVRLGYPTGPQAVAAVTAEVTGASLVEAFNGLLLAIPALTALAALAALGRLPPGRRVLAASLTGLPYLAASFLAQSAFKETAMALLVLAFAIVLGDLAAGSLRRRGALILALLAAASVFTYSIPGLAWFALGLPAWALLELAAGRRPDLARARELIGRHRAPLIGAGLVALVALTLSATQFAGFADRIGDVQASTGRLSSPVFPGEALGVWPEGDYRIVRGEVSGALPASALGLLAVALGTLIALRRREMALPAMLAAAGALYGGARLFAGIHVEAKALAILAPLAALVALRGLLAPVDPARDRADAGRGAARKRGGGPPALARYVVGAAFVVAAAGSTLLALRAAPVGFDDRALDLESLAARASGESVAFLGVDRAAAYRLRGTLAASPGGYVPTEVRARPEKVWRQGRAMDLDTLTPAKLDRFRYAVTTTAAYQSTPPPNMGEVARQGDYVLWERSGPTPRSRVLGEGGAAGRRLECSTGDGRRVARRGDEATLLPEPVVGRPGEWGRDFPAEAPARMTQELRLPPGRWALSLQYHSQAPLTVEGPGLRAELPPSLDGMYLTHQGQGAFWPAGEIEVPASPDGRPAPVTITLTAVAPSGLQNALGVRRSVWLGELVASAPGWPRPRGAATEPASRACGEYVDHYTLLERPARTGGE